MTQTVIKVALIGDLRKVMEDRASAVGQALRAAVDETAEEAKEELRKQVRRAGLGRGLEKAWQVVRFPPRRSQRTLSPAALVFSKAPRLHAAFDRANTIRASDANWLVIPSEVAVRAKLDRSLARSKGSRPRKWSDVAGALTRLGALRFVRLDGETAILVADRATKSGRLSKARRRRRGNRGQVLFILKRQVRSPKLLDIAAVARQVEARLARHVARRLGQMERLDRRAA